MHLPTVKHHNTRLSLNQLCLISAIFWWVKQTIHVKSSFLQVMHSAIFNRPMVLVIGILMCYYFRARLIRKNRWPSNYRCFSLWLCCIFDNVWDFLSIFVYDSLNNIDLSKKFCMQISITLAHSGCNVRMLFGRNCFLRVLLMQTLSKDVGKAIQGASDWGRWWERGALKRGGGIEKERGILKKCELQEFDYSSIS